MDQVLHVKMCIFVHLKYNDSQLVPQYIMYFAILNGIPLSISSQIFKFEYFYLIASCSSCFQCCQLPEYYIQFSHISSQVALTFLQCGRHVCMQYCK